MAWGMWRSADDGADARAILHRLETALECGIDFVDTADIYGFDGANGFGRVEELLGDALRCDPAMRERIVLASKGGIRPGAPYDQSALYMEQALNASLRRLRTERIDLYQIHRPDLLTHPQELAEFLDRAMASGKISAIGVSNFSVPQIETLAGLLDTPLATIQPETSALRIEPMINGELDQAMRLGLAPMAWSPLGGGRLLAPQTKRELAVAAALDTVAETQSTSRAVAALGWLLTHPADIIPIIGSQSPARIGEAVQAMQMRWTRPQWYSVFAAALGQPLP